MQTANLPVAVIGAGPIGLAAAAHLVKRGETPLVIEAGATIGASVLKWAHVRLFSPWQYNIDGAARELLQKTDWREPDAEHLPTGRELVEQYLAPLAALSAVKPHLRLNHRVISITRDGFDKMKTTGREKAPFLIRVRDGFGSEQRILARAVIDASGTYQVPNPAGAGGVPAVGETGLADHIFYGIPDVLGSDRARFAGKRIAVIGSGHSAVNALLDFAALAEDDSATEIIWIVRRTNTATLFGGEDRDQLAARGLLGSRARRLVESGRVKFVAGFQVAAATQTHNGIVISSDTKVLPAVDEIVAATGFRPDLEMLRELRLDLDNTVESPTALATLIDPNLHSCGTVDPHGADELKHPETDFYIAGMKSYGRAPTFLMMTGYEQVRSIVAAITGDWTAARQVELVLPETGVCKTDENGGDCCGVSETFQISRQKTVAIEPLKNQAPSAALNTAVDEADCCAPDCCAPASVNDSAAVPFALIGVSRTKN